jgi:hypothetical protein
MSKHLQAKVHVAKFNESMVSDVTELTTSMVDETSLAIHKRQGSQGILIASSLWKFRLNILV